MRLGLVKEIKRRDETDYSDAVCMAEGYTDWRLTPEQERRATQRLLADMYGGADDD